MHKAFECLAPIITLLAGAVSFLMLWIGIRAAIGRQIRVETGETLARIDENVKTLMSLTKTIQEDVGAMREDVIAMRKDVGALRD